MERFCDHCLYDNGDDKMCEIITLTMGLDLNDKDYPEEWNKTGDTSNGDLIFTLPYGVSIEHFGDTVTGESIVIIRDVRNIPLSRYAGRGEMTTKGLFHCQV